ncbi:MAG: hypothetical protein Q9227_003507 [Pyrenula ochraceoflavens]
MAGTSTMSVSERSDLGAGLKLSLPQPPPLPVQHGPPSQASRALSLSSYFLSGCMAINASQFLGAPLYLINKDWYNSWIAFTKQSFGILTSTMTQFWAPTKVRISGDSTVRGQLLKTVDGDLLCNFPDRLVLMANHQIYTDWMYLWWIAYTNGMHGRLYIILKESLKRIPVIGWGMQFCQFIFLKRNWDKDKANLSRHLQKLNQPKDPMWLLMFPEGTNLAPNTRKRSKKWAEKNGIADMRHQLLPRTTGLQFCLKELRNTVDYIYDCTIAYEGVQRGQFAQDIFTIKASYLEGRPPKSVNMYWRRFPISSIPLDNDKAFEQWLKKRWVEKDHLIEIYLRAGKFPADDGVDTGPDGKTRRGAGYIETEVKANRWYESLQIFAPMGLLALVLYMFYGALPRKFMKSMSREGKLESAQKKRLQDEQSRKKQQAMKRLEGAQRFQIDLPDLQLLRGAASQLLRGGQMAQLDKTTKQKLLLAAIAQVTGQQNIATSKSAAAQTKALGVDVTKAAVKQPPGKKPPLKALPAPKSVTSQGSSVTHNTSGKKAPLTKANVASVGGNQTPSTRTISTARQTSKAPTMKTFPSSKFPSTAPTVYTLSSSSSGMTKQAGLQLGQFKNQTPQAQRVPVNQAGVNPSKVSPPKPSGGTKTAPPKAQTPLRKGPVQKPIQKSNIKGTSPGIAKKNPALNRVQNQSQSSTPNQTPALVNNATRPQPPKLSSRAPSVSVGSPLNVSKPPPKQQNGTVVKQPPPRPSPLNNVPKAANTTNQQPQTKAPIRKAVPNTTNAKVTR